jgi:hypothetical protein
MSARTKAEMQPSHEGDSMRWHSSREGNPMQRRDHDFVGLDLVLCQPPELRAAEDRRTQTLHRCGFRNLAFAPRLYDSSAVNQWRPPT